MGTTFAMKATVLLLRAQAETCQLPAFPRSQGVEPHTSKVAGSEVASSHWLCTPEATPGERQSGPRICLESDAFPRNPDKVTGLLGRQGPDLLLGRQGPDFPRTARPAPPPR